MTRRYAYEISVVIGPDRDIPAPDMYTDAQTMAWIMDTYCHDPAAPSPGVVTGKPLALGGSAGRNEATARGALFCIREACAVHQEAAQGRPRGRPGLRQRGRQHRPAPARGRRARGRGQRQQRRGPLRQGPGPGAGPGPQARGRLRGRLQGRRAHHQRGAAGGEVRRAGARRAESQITQSNASRVRARIVAEAANGPTPPAADRVLREHGVFVVPDILCGAGGVTASYFEWAQNTQGRSSGTRRRGRASSTAMKRAFPRSTSSASAPRRTCARPPHAGRWPKRPREVSFRSARACSREAERGRPLGVDFVASPADPQGSLAACVGGRMSLGEGDRDPRREGARDRAGAHACAAGRRRSAGATRWGGCWPKTWPPTSTCPPSAGP